MESPRNKLGGLILCTDSYTLGEVKLLKNVLIKKFGFNCKLVWKRKSSKGVDQYRVRIKSNSMDKLIELVSPYMVPSMLYKFKFNLKLKKHLNNN